MENTAPTNEQHITQEEMTTLAGQLNIGARLKYLRQYGGSVVSKNTLGLELCGLRTCQLALALTESSLLMLFVNRSIGESKLPMSDYGLCQPSR